MKKLISIIFVIALLISTSKVFAHEKLANFYKHSEEITILAINSVVTKELAELEEASLKLRDLERKISSKIELIFLSTNDNALKNINSYKQNYETILAETHETLAKQMNFNNYTKNRKTELDAELTTDVGEILEEVLSE